MLGSAVLLGSWERLAAFVRRWEVACVFVFGCLLYLPFLGSYGLWDPWEGHYAEVARRMLQERDPLFMKWLYEPFHSKPPLTFWLMAVSMLVFGVGFDGGYSGEFVSSSWVEFAVRLPFALSGILGLVVVWWLVAKFRNRRAAWICMLVLATSPYYALISRQAITDMPMCALLIACLAIFLSVASWSESRPIWKSANPLLKHATATNIFVAAFALIAGTQLITFHLATVGRRLFLLPRVYIPGVLVIDLFLIAAVATAIWIVRTAKDNRQIWMYWFYLLAGLSVLAKGPVTPALAGLTILGYLTVTGRWWLLGRVELVRGLLIGAIVCLPWHFAMAVTEGQGWVNQYLGTHLVNRAFTGVHGDRGSFLYFVDQMGTGMWPWVALLPVALARAVWAPNTRSTDGLLSLAFIWTVLGFLFFSAVSTKFHHYVLPVVPGMAILIGCWLDEVSADKHARHVAAFGALVSLVLFVLLAFDLVPAQEELVRLFIYRYDRTIPRRAPWHIDYTWTLVGFAVLFGVALMFLAARRLRTIGLVGTLAVAVFFCFFCINELLVAASPHFGQRGLFETYYRERNVTGVDLTYRSRSSFEQDWANERQRFAFPCLVPETLKMNDPLTVGIHFPEDRSYELPAKVVGLSNGRVVAQLDPGAPWRTIRADATRLLKGHGRRHVSVRADRLIAKVYWRGEAFYSGGELWDTHHQETQSMFHEFNDADNKKLRKYLADHQGNDRQFWVVAEHRNLGRVKSMLPTQRARDSFEQRSQNTSSFFGLARFQL